MESSYQPDTAVDNFIMVKSSKTTVNLSSAYTFIEANKQTMGMRPKTASSSKSKFNFDKPSVRCSGPY